jgi:hypothetical protein
MAVNWVAVRDGRAEPRAATLLPLKRDVQLPSRVDLVERLDDLDLTGRAHRSRPPILLKCVG